jgi:RNA polymerase sigma factor (sigma-70 family)
MAAEFYPHAVKAARSLAPRWAWGRDRDAVISAVGLAVVMAAADWRTDGRQRFEDFARWRIPRMVADALKAERRFRRRAKIAAEREARRLPEVQARDAESAAARVELGWQFDRLPPKAAIVARSVLIDGLTSHAAARLARVRVEMVRSIVSAAMVELRRRTP